MSSDSRLRRAGRSILLGSLIGVGMAGCTTPEAGIRLTNLQAPQLDEEYNKALVSQDPALVTRFIRSHPENARSATLLNQMPSRVLASVPRSASGRLADNVKRLLTPRVRGQLGVTSSVTTRRPVPTPVHVGYDG